MSLYDQLSQERKELQAKGELPDWITTNSWQLLKDKYLFPGETLKERFRIISATAASYIPYTDFEWSKIFYKLLWSGQLAPSTPVLASMGRDKGCSVSCSGQYIGDSVYDFYMGQVETALLSKNGFGTSGYLGDIRPRGSKITDMAGGASGIVPVFKDYVQVARDISQGSQRRGAWAGYVEITHPDFYELVNYIMNNPDDANVGWIITNSFIEGLDKGNPDYLERYQKSLKLKMVTGKGYYFFKDRVNQLAPEWYKDSYEILASNLCTEIALPSSSEESFTCVLSSLNLTKWKEFERDTIFNSFIFLHCVALDFLKKAEGIKGLEKTVNFTRNHMALGLGALGYATYLQDNLIPFGSLEAHLWNISTFREIWDETGKASKWLATVFGEAPVTKGTGYANSTRIAIAPNLSSSLYCGGVSRGIEPEYKNAYIQGSAAGEMERVNPSLLKIMKERGVYDRDIIKEIIKNKGSVQWVDWLNDHEKEVFQTAFEIRQEDIIREAEARQPYIDQAQSINLFFSADESEEYISSVHKMAFKSSRIKSLYYVRSESGVQTNKGECIACGS